MLKTGKKIKPSTIALYIRGIFATQGLFSPVSCRIQWPIRYFGKPHNQGSQTANLSAPSGPGPPVPGLQKNSTSGSIQPSLGMGGGGEQPLLGLTSMKLGLLEHGF